MVSNYGIGGNEVKLDANEAIMEIPQNKTLIAQQLTESTPVRPEIVTGLTSIEQVFAHFKPEMKMDFINSDGATIIEELKFTNLGDFTVNGLKNQSQFLGDLDTENDQYRKIIMQLKTNKILKAALDDPEAKAALINTLNSLIAELDEA